MRTYKVGKTREGNPRVTLYEGGRALLVRRVESVKAGNRLGRAWADSEVSA